MGRTCDIKLITLSALDITVKSFFTHRLPFTPLPNVVSIPPIYDPDSISFLFFFS